MYPINHSKVNLPNSNVEIKQAEVDKKREKKKFLQDRINVSLFAMECGSP